MKRYFTKLRINSTLGSLENGISLSRASWSSTRVEFLEQISSARNRHSEWIDGLSFFINEYILRSVFRSSPNFVSIRFLKSSSLSIGAARDWERRPSSRFLSSSHRCRLFRSCKTVSSRAMRDIGGWVCVDPWSLPISSCCHR